MLAPGDDASASAAMTTLAIERRMPSQRSTIAGRRARHAPHQAGAAASNPRPTARITSIAKLIQRICSGVSGAPSAMSKMPGADEEEDERAEHDQLDADVLHEVVVDLDRPTTS